MCGKIKKNQCLKNSFVPSANPAKFATKRYGTAILGKNLYEHIQNNKLDLFKDAGEYLFEYNKDIEKYGKDYFINKHKSLLKDEADSLLHEAVIDFDIVKIKAFR